MPQRLWFMLSSVSRRHTLLCFALVAFYGCSSVPVREGSENVPAGNEPSQYDDGDPLEGLNRAIFTFNDKFDRYLLKPIAKGYRAITPSFMRKGVSNFFSNLYDPANIVHNFLQGKFAAGTSDVGRFLFNSTFGILGLFDVATPLGFEKHDEDFGQTFGVWGAGDGPYLVLPILGSSSLRDGLGRMPDWYLYPPTYMEQRSTASKVMLLELINRREQLLDASDILDQAAGEDPYVFVREAYRQRRQSLIYDGNPPAPPVDPSLFEPDPPPASK